MCIPLTTGVSMIVIKKISEFVDETRRTTWLEMNGYLERLVPPGMMSFDEYLSQPWSEVSEEDRVVSEEDVYELLKVHTVPVMNDISGDETLAFVGKDEDDEEGAEEKFTEFLNKLRERFMMNMLKSMVDVGILDYGFDGKDFVFDLTSKGHDIAKSMGFGE